MLDGMEEERPTEEKDPGCCIAEHARAHISLSEPIIIFLREYLNPVGVRFLRQHFFSF